MIACLSKTDSDMNDGNIIMYSESKNKTNINV